jgi:hypothetical protein
LTSAKVLKYHLKLNECNLQTGSGEFLNNPPNSIFIRTESAFQKFLQVFSYKPESIINDSTKFLLEIRKEIKNLLFFAISKLKSIKDQMCLSVNFIKGVGNEKTEQISYFQSVTRPISNISLFNNLFLKIINDIDSKIQDYVEKGSGWIVNDIYKIDIRIGVYNPIYGSCYCDLPYYIKNKKAIINIKNNDDKCFL